MTRPSPFQKQAVVLLSGGLDSMVCAGLAREAGFKVLAMEGIDSPFAAVPSVPPEQVLEFMKRIAAKHKESEGIYMLGSAWKTVEIIDRLEKDTGLTVVHAGAARAWETQLRLGLRHRIPGYGRLLAEMPQ